ncbi:MAG: transketolase, partial [Eubacteriales bacterium]|nr:transketolase [Eubacteriales bacterium]
MQYDEQTLLRLRDIANRIRLMGLEMVYQSRSGHLGGAFSMAEILAVLYFHTMRIDPQQPHWAQRDRLVLSKGHGTVALYPALSLRGFFPEAELATFRRMDSRLSGHAEIHVPGVDMSTGSLGQGLSAAVGMALSARIHQQDYRTYAICGDGEIEEGQIWEAAMFAAHYKLRCLTLIVDHNRLQLDGPVKDVMDLKDIGAKFTAFGWHTVRVDGHSV